MFDRLRSIFAARRTSNTRDPDEIRVPYSGRTLAGIGMSPDRALQVPAVWACVRFISSSIAMLPWHVHRKTDAGNEIVTSHGVDWLLDVQPAAEWSAFTWRETMIGWALLWGNAVAEIEKDTSGRVIGLHPIEPWRVEVRRSVGGTLEYRVNNQAGQAETILSPDEVYHLRGLGNGPVGLGVIEYAAETLGWARAAALFGAGFFGNGLNVTGVVQVKGKLTDPTIVRFKTALKNIYRGVRGDRTLFLDNGAEYHPVSISPDKAQFLETNKHLVEEICRLFGVPPHAVQSLERSTNNNIEHQGIEAVVYCLAPWAKRMELEARIKLFGQNRPNFYTKLNLAALLRGDAKSRGELYQFLFNTGAISPNEIRQLEDMNKIGPDGDKRMVQSQYTTLERIGEEPIAAPVAASNDDEMLAAALDRVDIMAVEHAHG